MRHRPAATTTTCRCGGWYGDDMDGRNAHHEVFGHRPIEAEVIEQNEHEQIEETP